ncbi:extensin-like [Pecten maximus]|uniref:extensin-like n=1 Tax=Pecten maximus TaxID=6579 RepID=UPI001457EB40|nr:extensin-like [Pecten maximus]
MELLSDMMFVALVLMGCLAGSMATWSSPEYSTSYDAPDSQLFVPGQLYGLATSPYQSFDSSWASFSADPYTSTQVSYQDPSVSSISWASQDSGSPWLLSSPQSYINAPRKRSSQPPTLRKPSPPTSWKPPPPPKIWKPSPPKYLKPPQPKIWKPSIPKKWKPPPPTPWKPPPTPWKPPPTPWKPMKYKPWKPIAHKPWQPITYKPWQPITHKPWQPITYRPTIRYSNPWSTWNQPQISSGGSSVSSNAFSVSLGDTSSNSGIFTSLNQDGYSALPKQHSVM